MITADLVYFRHGQYLSTFREDGAPMTRAEAEAHKAQHPDDPGGLASVAYCRVCGDALEGLGRQQMAHSAGWRCERHRMRNPCAIEGCRRSTQGRGGWHGLALWLCGEHWRIGVPPRSPERRVYNRLFRQAKRQGWTHEMDARFWRIWTRMVARARARVGGDIDEAEIKRLFGWD